MKHLDKIHAILPLAYLYLVVLGIIKESIVFYQLGINIIKYTTIMDILLSPIAVITSHPLIFVVFILISIYPFTILRLFKNHSHKKWVRVAFGIKKNKDDLSEEEAESYGNSIFIKSFVWIYLSVFLGIAFQEGRSISQDIKTKKLKYDYKMHFESGSAERVSLIGSNSEYFFCVVLGNKNIQIVPIGSVRKIEQIKNKMLP